MRLYVNYEFNRSRPGVGWAQMTREDDDGCNPHVLTPWQAYRESEAKAWAKREGAIFRNHGPATP